MTGLPVGAVGIAVVVLMLAVPLAVILGGTTGRFWGAVRRRPTRALSFFEADDAWVVLGDDEAREDLGDGYDGPYMLELPDGRQRVIYGRKDRMIPSMRRYLRRLP